MLSTRRGFENAATVDMAPKSMVKSLRISAEGHYEADATPSVQEPTIVRIVFRDNCLPETSNFEIKQSTSHSCLKLHSYIVFDKILLEQSVQIEPD